MLAGSCHDLARIIENSIAIRRFHRWWWNRKQQNRIFWHIKSNFIMQNLNLVVNLNSASCVALSVKLALNIDEYLATCTKYKSESYRIYWTTTYFHWSEFPIWNRYVNLSRHFLMQLKSLISFRLALYHWNLALYQWRSWHYSSPDATSYTA